MSRLLFLICVFSLMLVSTTNADFTDTKIIKNNKLVATTLDFSKLKTTNNSNIETIFNIDGILAGGYQVNTLRIKNEGGTNLNYLLNFEKINGDDNFCRQLEVNLIKDGQSKYQGNLIDLNLDNLLDKGQNFSDWLIYIKLKDNYLNSNSETCDFNININGFNNNQKQKSGFKYRRSIFNHISST